MKAKDTVAMNATRAIKGEILLFKTSEGGSKEVTDGDILKMIQKLVKQRKEAAEQFVAAGRQMLQVPVVHGASWRMADVRVDYSTPWVVRTQRALDTAYETAAYYEYYRDEVFALLDARPETLWELNLSTARFLLDKMGVAAELVPSARFAIPGSVADDYRYGVHPKHPDSILEDLGLALPYYQVFRDRMGGFTPRLSGLDLLFNEGPDSIGWIKRLH